MGEPRLDRSRRKVMGAIAKGVSAGLLFGLARAEAAEKMTRAQADYQDMPNGIYSCGVCTLFVPPDACKVVEGEVSKDGWCKAFALAD
ncbi:high potential iron sulfur protein [Bradyrhizobium sp.]|uniref:high potential iron sulfur protein n=1 Tax=Bradyrhizobium sp. TaxID=376 RepID=UPI003C3A5A89